MTSGPMAALVDGQLDAGAAVGERQCGFGVGEFSYRFPISSFCCEASPATSLDVVPCPAHLPGPWRASSRSSRSLSASSINSDSAAALPVRQVRAVALEKTAR